MILTECFFPDPCNATDVCMDVNSQCVYMGNNTTTCRCNKGYFKDNNNDCAEVKDAYSVGSVSLHYILKEKHSFHYIFEYI